MPTPQSGGMRTAAAGHPVSFSGHETFPFRQTWLKKAVDAVDRDPLAFRSDDAMVELGVGRNMVSSMRHWALATGMLEAVETPAARRRRRGRPLRASELGARLLRDGGWDPYLEDPGTLWLLHWRLARRPERVTTWWWVFNCFTGGTFTRAELVQGLETLARLRGWTRLTPATLKRDIEVFVRTYAPAGRTAAVAEDTLECPLADLGIVRPSRQPHTYGIVRGAQASLPPDVFAFALAEYLVERARARTVTLEELLFGDGAPGRVCCLDEVGLLARLDCLEALTGGSLVFDETAGLKQLYVHGTPDPAALLEDYYTGGDSRGGAAPGAGAPEQRAAVGPRVLAVVGSAAAEAVRA